MRARKIEYYSVVLTMVSMVAPLMFRNSELICRMYSNPLLSSNYDSWCHQILLFKWPVFERHCRIHDIYYSTKFSVCWYMNGRLHSFCSLLRRHTHRDNVDSGLSDGRLNIVARRVMVKCECLPVGDNEK